YVGDSVKGSARASRTYFRTAPISRTSLQIALTSRISLQIAPVSRAPTRPPCPADRKSGLAGSAVRGLVLDGRAIPCCARGGMHGAIGDAVPYPRLPGWQVVSSGDGVVGTARFSVSQRRLRAGPTTP